MENESCGCGGPENCYPKVVSSSSGAGCHFELAVPHSSRDKGVAGSKNNLKCQWVIRMSSGMAHSRAVSMGRGFTFPGGVDVVGVEMR